MNTIKSTFIAASMVVCGTSLSAADPAFGFQAAVAFPVNDLTNAANQGLVVGGHGRWDLGNGHGLMPRVDVGIYGSKDGYSTSSFGVGGDYTYHFDHNGRGVYLLAGATFMSYSISHGGGSRSGLGPEVGVGLDLDRHLGLQLRYTTHNLDNATMTSLNLGVTYTF